MDKYKRGSLNKNNNLRERSCGDYTQLRYNKYEKRHCEEAKEKHMHTHQQTKKVSGLYENITQGVLNDFALHFNTPSKKEVAAAPKKREEKPQEIHQEPVPVVLK